MFDELHANKRRLHRRIPAVKNLHARFDPTYIWTDFGTPTLSAATPTDSPAPPNTPVVQQSTPQAVTPSPTPSSAPAPAATPSLSSQGAAPASDPTPSNSSALSSPTPSTPSDTPSSTPAATPSTTVPTNPSVVVTSPLVASVSDPTLSRSVGSATGVHTGVTAAGLVSASATATGTPAATVSTGVVIGGVIAGIAGLAGIIFAVTWFMRRRREDNEFDADAFRRQSVVLPNAEPPRGGLGMGRDWDTTPQTPNMFEQRVTGHGPNMFEQRFPGPPPTQPWSGYQSQPTPSFGPGQYVTMQDTGRQEYEPDLPMQTPNSAQPFFSPMGQTPLGSPISVAPYGSVFDNQPVSRQNSAGPSAYLSRQPSTNAGTLEPPEAHYVDLSRSSVTPFQAQQYEEISRRLNVPPPAALPAVAEHPVIDELPVEHIVAQSEPSLEVHAVTSDEVQATTKSPFADPEGRDSPMVTPGALPDPEDGDNTSIDGFPQPPSPTFTTSSRINSTPPVLPEIQVQQRAFSPTVMEFPLVPGASRPAPAPSPLASSHTPPTPPASAHIADKPVQLNTIQVHAESANKSRPQRDELAVNRPDTVYTLYDDEDAYGGI